VRSPDRARHLAELGASKVIVGTAAFSSTGINTEFLEVLCEEIGRDRVVVALDSKDGRIVIKGWREATQLSAEDVLGQLEPYCSGFLCTYVDKEGMLQGTDLDWYRRLRAATDLELTAAGGISSVDEIRELARLNIHAALGMAIYTGRLSLDELARMGL
jgi:phosphoribosylformimino-5-aminoimidazole carboxamide ribonucleotide (ProFAR) isomerase